MAPAYYAGAHTMAPAIAIASIANAILEHMDRMGDFWLAKGACQSNPSPIRSRNECWTNEMGESLLRGRRTE